MRKTLSYLFFRWIRVVIESIAVVAIVACTEYILCLARDIVTWDEDELIQ